MVSNEELYNRNEPDSKLERFIRWAVVVISVIFIIGVNVKRYIDRNDVIEHYAFTQGKIIKYYRIGGNSYYFDYTYEVSGKIYERSIGSRRFIECYSNFELCRNKRFWVAYSLKNPSASLINLYIETQDAQDTRPPTSLEWFE